jgi:hypothetical protein
VELCYPTRILANGGTPSAKSSSFLLRALADYNKRVVYKWTSDPDGASYSTPTLWLSSLKSSTSSWHIHLPRFLVGGILFQWLFLMLRFHLHCERREWSRLWILVHPSTVVSSFSSVIGCNVLMDHYPYPLCYSNGIKSMEALPNANCCLK